MLNRNLFEDKKAQVASASSWLVATLVIIFLLSASIFVASLMAETKVVTYTENQRSEDVVMLNSIFGYFSLSDSSLRDGLYGVLSRKNDENKFYGNFVREFDKIKGVVG